MTIATEKIKNASERFLLVRLEPARYVLPTSIGGGVYESSFPYPISKVQRNGTDLTRVSSLSNNDEFTFDETTGSFQVKLASAPNDTTNVIIVFYYLFYTGVKNRYHPQTPTDTSTTTREWLPRITKYPSFFESFSNIRQGILTIAESSISLISDDREFQQYLSDDDSFYQKKVDIWMCLNSISNIQKVYTGTVTDIKIMGNVVSLGIADSFNKLKQMAYMGDSEGECIFSRESGSFPDMDPKKSGRPCPYIVASSSRYQSFVYDVPPATLRIVVEGTEGFCTDYSDLKAVTTNREWGLCRSQFNVPTQTDITGLISSSTQLGSTGFYRITHSGGVGNFFVGDTFHYTQASVHHYALISEVSSTYIDVTNYTAVPLTSLTHVPAPSMAIVIRELPYADTALFIHTICIPFYHRDYTLTTTTTSGGNKFHSITFTNDFEANFPGGSPLTNPFGPVGFILDPDIHQVHYRVSASVVGAAEELRKILQKVGFSAPLATYTNIDTLISQTAAFHIPNIDEDTYDTYLKYVEDILASLLCYLIVDDIGRVTIAALTIPSSTDTRDNALMLDGSTTMRLDYQDIVTRIIPYNPHNDLSDPNIDTSVSSTKAQYLHSVNNTNRMKHCLSYINERIADHINLKSQRTVIYSYEVATEDIDSELGDDVLLDNRIVLGSSEQKAVKIISLDKSPGKIAVEASDLLGISDVEA